MTNGPASPPASQAVLIISWMVSDHVEALTNVPIVPAHSADNLQAIKDTWLEPWLIENFETGPDAVIDMAPINDGLIPWSVSDTTQNLDVMGYARVYRRTVQ